MAIVHLFRALRLDRGVHAENFGGCLAPIGAAIVGVEQPQIVDEMAFVICGQLRYVGRAICKFIGAHGAPVMLPVNQFSANC